MAKKIAIVEDEAELAALLDYNLTRGGYQAHVLTGNKGALKDLEACKPDLIVLDVMLPDDGWIRAMPPDPPVGGPGPHAGAFSDRPLRRSGPRAGAGNRRRRLHDQALQPARTGGAREGPPAPRRDATMAKPPPWRSDRSAWTAAPAACLLRGRELDLTSTEFNLLEFFLTHPGRAYSRDQLWRRSGASSALSLPARWMCTSGACASRSRSNRTTRAI